MLKQRIISALILVPLVVLAVLRLDSGSFAMVAAVAVLLGAWEWGALIPLRSLPARVSFVVVTLACVVLVWQFAQSELLVNSVLWSAMGGWILMLFWITAPALGRADTSFNALLKALLGIAVLVSTWLALVVLHSRPDEGPRWVLFLLLLIWFADSGAYFAGRQWGRTKLAPEVSPGKTWEGVMGALTVCTLFAFGFGRYIGLQGAMLASFTLVCLVTVLFSIAGDLLESLLKRHHGVKDSGTLIPGHGGVLDRIDSLLAAAPVFVFGLRWISL
ncbi:phosphatidate cytidylyltransferase [Thiogranum longum]|uniref:Phosphatidate cytidylyltransferase n=1 Tax=Thiogranum longum TaxID=1537524 RepID=A0A4R1HMH9_9GAMM|nr:phosphatidate cytidylyltransferase [Thiogranum longum]TCK18452.1 phosphatidate cytidylyltransferase [Thiogranum longum]